MSSNKKKYAPKTYSYNKMKTRGTGGLVLKKSSNQITCPFGKYNVTVKVSKDQKFVGISEIRINKDFRSYRQKLMPKGYHDVEDFYKK
jgi:uncharacterized membrane protein